VIQNIRLAIDTLHDKYKVPKLLEPNDIAEHHDEISLIIYLSQCYQVLQ
jgi:hypothetical protein